MRKYTQADFDSAPRDEVGYLRLPAGDWTEVDFGGAGQIDFASKREAPSVFAAGSRFGDDVTFCAESIFGDRCTFGDGCFFAPDTRLGRGCKFGVCSFDISCHIDMCAEIGAGSSIGDGCHIGEQSTVGDGSTIGDYCKIGASFRGGEEIEIGKEAKIDRECHIGRGSSIGDNSKIDTGLVLGQGCSIGAECIILDWLVADDECEFGAGCVIGSHRFGRDCTMGDGIKMGAVCNMAMCGFCDGCDAGRQYWDGDKTKENS